MSSFYKYDKSHINEINFDYFQCKIDTASVVFGVYWKLCETSRFKIYH